MVDNPSVAVCVEGLTKSFGEGHAVVHALRGIDMKIKRAEFVAIMGPSGSGKSTLLHLVGGLDEPTAGQVSIGGQSLQAMNDDHTTLLRRRHVGFLFQAFNLIQVLTAEENVALPLVIDGTNEQQAHVRAGTCLELVGVGGRRDHYPATLSGGEQQRVAIARALCPQPVLLLADEPTGNLDSHTGNQIMALLRRLVDQHDQTVLMVTHDAAHAAYADRILTLRDGVIEDEQILPNKKPVNQVLKELEQPS